jgi:Holliday junction resolvase RusA-like endonuclease
VSLTGRAKAYAEALQVRAREAVTNLGGANALALAWGERALAVDILCQFPTTNTTRWGQLHIQKPDGDNLAKMVLDCLQRAGALGGDDSRAAICNTTKRWGADGFMTVTVRLVATQSPTRPDPANTTLEAAPAWLRR